MTDTEIYENKEETLTEEEEEDNFSADISLTPDQEQSFAEAFAKIRRAIDAIDTELDSLSGSQESVKRQVTQELVSKHENTWTKPVESAVNGLKEMSPDVKAAVYSALVSALQENFGQEVSGYIKGLVDSAPKQEPMINEAQAKSRREARSTFYAQCKSIHGMAETLGFDLSKFEMPKMRRGSTGKRKARNLSLFTFVVDDVELPADTTLPEIATMGGYEKYGDLTKALRTPVEDEDGKVIWAGFDTAKGKEFSDFVMKNGKKLSGFRDDEDEGEEEEEEEESEETETE